MKRRLTKLVVFLLLGAIVNLTVAWGCMIVWPKSHTGNVVYYQEDDLHPTPALGILESLVPSEESLRRSHTIVISDESRFGWVEHGAQAVPDRESVDHGLFVSVIDAGLPLKSLRCSYRTTNAGGRPSSPREGYFHAVMIPSWMRPAESRLVLWYGFPFLPIWPGFAINTVFCAAILWLLTLGPFAAHRMIRRKRGLCIKCGYDLRGAEHEQCPECGMTIPLRITIRS